MESDKYDVENSNGMAECYCVVRGSARARKKRAGNEGSVQNFEAESFDHGIREDVPGDLLDLGLRAFTLRVRLSSSRDEKFALGRTFWIFA